MEVERAADSAAVLRRGAGRRQREGSRDPHSRRQHQAHRRRRPLRRPHRHRRGEVGQV